MICSKCKINKTNVSLCQTCEKKEIAYQKAWLKGAIDALEMYAWWKNGVQYVGCGACTLESAKDDARERAKGIKL